MHATVENVAAFAIDRCAATTDNRCCAVLCCVPHVCVYCCYTDIKKRIENLIEREFLERDANDRKLYTYLA